MVTNTNLEAILAEKSAILTKGLAAIESIESRRMESRWFTGESASPKSTSEYKKIGIRLEKKMRVNQLTGAADFVDEAKKTKSQNTWFKRRAAIIYCVSKIIKLHASRFDLWHKAQASDKYSMHKNFISDLEYENTLLDRAVKILILIEEEKWIKKDAIGNKKKTINSKKDILRFLPDDWRERILDAVPYHSRLAVLTAIVSGCRPAELKKGIEMEFDERGLVITIQGAKVKEHAGQKERELTFSFKNSFTSELSNLVCEDGGFLRAKISNALEFTRLIQSAAKRSIPNLKHSVTAYCFRHQFAADFKNDLSKPGSTLTIADLAGSLGHLTDEMQRKYGHVRQSKSQEGTGLLSVKTNRTVKNKQSTPFYLMRSKPRSPSP